MIIIDLILFYLFEINKIKSIIIIIYITLYTGGGVCKGGRVEQRGGNHPISP